MPKSTKIILNQVILRIIFKLLLKKKILNHFNPPINLFKNGSHKNLYFLLIIIKETNKPTMTKVKNLNSKSWFIFQLTQGIPNFNRLNHNKIKKMIIIILCLSQSDKNKNNNKKFSILTNKKIKFMIQIKKKPKILKPFMVKNFNFIVFFFSYENHKMK